MNQPVVGVLDYGSGNLHSACRALEAAGARVLLGQRWADFGGAAGLVLPGVGAFAACMSQLRAIAGDDLVREWVAAERKLLGICVGHQVLFTRGVEHGVDSAGIGIFPGTVERLAAQRLPHMGWNTIEPPCDQAYSPGCPVEGSTLCIPMACTPGTRPGGRQYPAMRWWPGPSMRGTVSWPPSSQAA